ncbi:MAG: Mrp/NBP35 family ATP-binding protein [Crocinitomicaceae bacterium]|nr:Mrp/NBP35 family ATP-binding protein [Crocinitomicaceae bacterium]
MKISRESVFNALSNIIEPDLKKDIVSLGLVKIIDVKDGAIILEVKVSNPAMHARMRMKEACEFAIHRVIGNEWKVEIEVLPIGSDERNGELRKVLPGVKNIIAVASGKGGVGKSTVSVNLAVGLAKKGFAVGMLDADIYGPSAPTMFDIVHEKPAIVEVNGKNLIQPVEQYGVKVLSIGFFAEVNQAVVWRGPMATKALNQLINDGNWGKLDYLVVDLPPGTGDVHLSIVQSIPLTGAIIVSTPQEVALADAKKGVAMFQLPAINIPIIGIVENMSWFTPKELPENRYFLFGKDGAKNLADDLKIPFLGHLPLIQSIRESGDAGRPAILQQDTASSVFLDEFLANFEREMRMLPFRVKKTVTQPNTN